MRLPVTNESKINLSWKLFVFTLRNFQIIFTKEYFIYQVVTYLTRNFKGSLNKKTCNYVCRELKFISSPNVKIYSHYSRLPSTNTFNPSFYYRSTFLCVLSQIKVVYIAHVCIPVVLLLASQKDVFFP